LENFFNGDNSNQKANKQTVKTANSKNNRHQTSNIKQQKTNRGNIKQQTVNSKHQNGKTPTWQSKQPPAKGKR
jgi:hypothetical protein